MSALRTTVRRYMRSMPTGFHWNPNNFSVAMSIALPYIVVRTRGWRRILLVAAVLLVIIQAGSRADVSAAFVILALCVSVYRLQVFRVRTVLRNVLLSVLLMAVAIAALSAPGLSSRGAFATKLADVSNIVTVLRGFLLEDVADTSSTGVRQELVRNGLRVLLWSNGVGVGGGNSPVVQAAQGLTTLSMHNCWIELLVEGGVGLFAVVLAFHGALMVELTRLGFRSSVPAGCSRSAEVAALALMGFVTAAISASSVVYLLPMYVLYGYSIGVVNMIRSRTQRLAVANPDRPAR